MSSPLPTAVIGAGPVGLAAAAELAARGLPFLVIERGPAVGHAVRDWAHVRVFSPWRMNVAPAARRQLEAVGWRHPDPDALPTGGDIVRDYLEPLAGLPAIAATLKLGTRVVAVARQDTDKVVSAGRAERPFVLRLESAGGAEESIEAGAVIDASGTWWSPNPLGADGLAAPGERAARAMIDYGIPDSLGAARERYAGRAVLVVGGGHSALNALLDLAALAKESPGTRILWAIRRGDPSRAFGGGAADRLSARGALGSAGRALLASGAVELLAPFRARAVHRAGGDRLVVEGTLGDRAHTVTIDRIVVATGFRPEIDLLRELRLDLDPALECPRALAPLIDPNVHSCGTVPPHGAAELAQPEPGLYVVGMKSYGRAPTFLMATGYEQVRSVVAALAGDHEAAARVELVLPETGVCGAPAVADAAACCGPQAEETPALAAAAGCCGPKVGTVVEPVAAAASCCGPAVVAPAAAAPAEAACCVPTCCADEAASPEAAEEPCCGPACCDGARNQREAVPAE